MGSSRNDGESRSRKSTYISEHPAAQQVVHLNRVLQPDDVVVGHDEHHRRMDPGDLLTGPVLRLCVQLQHIADEIGPPFRVWATASYAR